MPYCIADGFAQSMLVKAKLADLPLWNTRTIYTADNDESHSENQTMATIEHLEPWVLSWSFSISYWYAWYYVRADPHSYRILVNGVVVASKSWSWNSGSDTVTGTCNITKWDSTVVFQLTGQTLGTYDYIFTKASGTISLTPKIIWKTTGGAVPTEVKSIWQQITVSIFWVFDWEFFVWVETNSATTGSITPWNFVWYLQIWDYKIPYYK